VHKPSIEELDEATTTEMMELAKRAAAAHHKVYDPDGFNYGINQGKVAGAGIEDHTHMHVVPRWNGDTNFMPVTGDTRMLNQSLADSWKELRSAF
jgi:ATP adenylyltransferase